MLANDGRSISWNVVYLNILVHGVINLLYYEYWTDKQKYFHVNWEIFVAYICMLDFFFL